MFVGFKMLQDFATVTPQTLVKDAQKKLEEDKLWMLLVVDEAGELVGYVPKEDIAGALPGVVKAMERLGETVFLDKLTIEDILRRDIRKISPEAEVEAAADMMHEMNLAGLAVVDGAGVILGYVNRDAMLDVLVEEMGFREGGCRITVDVEDKTGVLYEAAGVIANMKLSIISSSTFFKGERRLIVLRVATEDAAPVETALRERGFKLVEPQDFQGNWN
ncbi:CBS domain-containing protein [Salidesulfovibrio onnuriiensis]|uniref:CBS domain-containing protein n=1 Tax=Salidesulfovibrio onnuriiensis TaxID=2583823 RepID=UPI0011CC6B93|nr:CBS domain-containing protein [Salidesulfovibrio onnuriiensis]